MRPVVVQMSLQSRQSRTQRTRSSTSGSARSASAQLVQLSAQSEHSSIHRMSTARSTLVGCGCVWTISRTVKSAPPSRSLWLCRNAPSACPRSTSSSSEANGMPLLVQCRGVLYRRVADAGVHRLPTGDHHPSDSQHRTTRPEIEIRQFWRHATAASPKAWLGIGVAVVRPARARSRRHRDGPQRGALPTRGALSSRQRVEGVPGSAGRTESSSSSECRGRCHLLRASRCGPWRRR